MMKDVYLFNPEHDLALAHGAHNYTAPPFARQFRHDLRSLPGLKRTAAGCLTIILILRPSPSAKSQN